MRCPACETDNRSAARFCRRCGVALPAPAAQAPEPVARISCPRCGASLRSGARFCAKCGQSVGAPSSLPAQPVGDGFAQPLAGRAVPMPVSSNSPPAPPVVVYASPAYSDIPTPGKAPARRRSRLWLWLIVAVILCLVIVLIAARVVQRFDMLSGRTSPSVDHPAVLSMADATLALAISHNPVQLAAPVTVTVTFTNTEDVDLHSVRVYLDDAGQPCLALAPTAIDVSHDIELTPGAREVWIFVLDAVAVGDATLAASVAAELRADPPSPGVWRAGPLPFSVDNSLP